MIGYAELFIEDFLLHFRCIGLPNIASASDEHVNQLSKDPITNNPGRVRTCHQLANEPPTIHRPLQSYTKCIASMNQPPNRHAPFLVVLANQAAKATVKVKSSFVSFAVPRFMRRCIDRTPLDHLFTRSISKNHRKFHRSSKEA